MQSRLKILFLDDHEGLRDGIGFLLSKENENIDFCYASTIEESLSLLQNNPDISLAIVDLNLDGEDGLKSIEQLRKIKEKLPVIIYTMYSDPIHIENALKADIQGYITKNSKTEELLKGIELVAGGSNFYNAAASKILQTMISGNNNKTNTKENKDKNDSAILFVKYKALTKSEQKVFYLLAQKKEPEEVAKALGKSIKTVINQRSIIYQKLNISDRLDLIEYAEKLGLSFADREKQNER